MKKSTIILIVVIVLAAVLALVWWAQERNRVDDSTTPATQQPATTPPVGTDYTGQEEVTVNMSNNTFSPAYITVSPGTTVTWVNDDTMAHNVVADDPTNTGGLPTEAPVFGLGETFSHTFDEIGVFTYHCTPHPFMQGTVEVVES